MERLIFHVDVNSAFLSWEAARRVRAGQDDLRQIASAVGGDRDKRTGVILAKSIPAKKQGVKTGEPVAMALRKCPELVLVKPDFHLYEQSSRAFMAVCRRYAPVVEPFSIDECFLDMTGTHRIYPDPIAIAHQIKDEIRDTLGFTVNIGVGSNKLLAKTAGDFEKPDRVHTLFSSEIPQKLWPLPIGDLLSVGQATAQRLRKAGLETVGALATAPLERVQKLVGKALGLQLWDYANGRDNSPVSAEPEPAKGYSISTTLENDVMSREAAYPVLLQLCDNVTARMRADGARAYRVSVTIRGSDFQDKSHQCSLPEATDGTEQVYRLTRRLFEELWDGVTPLRLLGVSLSNVTREEGGQLTMFASQQNERARQLDRTVDAIRSRFGQASVSRGGSLKSGAEVGRKYRAQMEIKGKK